MVEQVLLDNIFKSLADPTRRDILARVYKHQQTISDLAIKYKMSFAAVAKHINVLEKAGLVSKRRRGKEQVVTINGQSFKQANQYLQDYEALWNKSFDRLEHLITKEKQ